MVGVLEGVGTHTQHETTRNHTQPRRFPTPTAEQLSNDATNGRSAILYVTIPLGLPLNLSAKISNFYQRLQVPPPGGVLPPAVHMAVQSPFWAVFPVVTAS